MGGGLEGGQVGGGDNSESCPAFKSVSISSPGHSSEVRGQSPTSSSPSPTARDSTTVGKVSTDVRVRISLSAGAGAPVPGGPGAGVRNRRLSSATFTGATSPISFYYNNITFTAYKETILLTAHFLAIVLLLSTVLV